MSGKGCKNYKNKISKLSKIINGTYYIAFVSPDAANKTIHIKSMFISNKGIKNESNQVFDVNGPKLTSETNLDILSTDSVPQSKTPVNNNDMPENENKNPTNQSGIRYSIQTDNVGKYVKIDTEQDIFVGKTIRDKQEIARKIILSKFRNKVLNVGINSNA